MFWYCQVIRSICAKICFVSHLKTNPSRILLTVGVKSIGHSLSIVTGVLFVFGILRTSTDFHEEGSLPWGIEGLNIDDDGEQRI